MSNSLRKLKRGVAHKAMKLAGCVNVNKHYKGQPSFFSEHWKDSIRLKPETKKRH